MSDDILLSRRIGWRVTATGLLMLGCVVGCVRSDVGSSQTPSETPARSDEGRASGLRLADVTSISGIDFRHDDGGSGKKYIVEAIAGGMATFDYDGDGWIDIYFLNGAPLPPREPDATITNVLYRNEGGFRFRDVTAEAGVGDTGYGLGVTAGDFDNDGDQDLYVNNFGPNVLYRNNGDGTFTDISNQAGVSCGECTGAGACFLDADGDGDLELYAANYVDFQVDKHVPHMQDGIPTQSGPLCYHPVADVFFSNNGDGTFADVSQASGIGQVAGNSMGLVCSDYDKDGDTDVFVLNDLEGNFFFVNNGLGQFHEMGMVLGVGYNFKGIPTGSMGVDCGDYDNDGWLDFFMTCYSREQPVLYRNESGKMFEDVTSRTGAGEGSEAHVNWGTSLADFDNDADQDLFIANGHIDPDVDRRDVTTAFRVRNLILENMGQGQFVNVSRDCGDGLEPVESSRGIGVDDLDNDGDLDVVVLNLRAGVTVLRNESRVSNHWLQIDLRGTTANRDGVGSQVLVTAGGRTQWDEVHSGRGYQSHHGTRLHFGIGERERVEEIEVLWLGGERQVIQGVQADQKVTIIQGDSRVLYSSP